MSDRPIEGAAGVILYDPGQPDIRAELTRIDLTRADGQGVAEEMRRRLAAVRRPYRDDPWLWIMVVLVVVIGSIIVAAIRLPEILHAFGLRQ
jgi:hypothetical protein